MGPQTSIAHYRITSKLGEGGMGAVYRATDTKLQRDVAIKVIPDTFAADPDRLARFTREAQVLASLNHPNIAAIYGVEDRAIVMELVDGQTLAGPLPVHEALPLIHQLIDALEYAHEKGVVHRDLKPANIKITPEGRLKVLDFGLAKALSNETPAGDPAASPTLTMRATLAGTIMGTAAYMAPEQARGHAVDRRADIWAFGVVVYELLTGRMLFEAPTVSDTLAAVLTRDPDLSQIPLPLRRLLQLCLVRDPKQRLRDISSARLVLELPAAPAAPPAARKRFTYAWIGPMTAMTALAVAGWMRTSTPPDAPLLRLPVTLGASNDAAFFQLQLSPDGRRIVYGVRSDKGISLVGRNLSESKTVQLSPTTGAYFAFSPDSQSVAFTMDGRLAKVSITGGAPVPLCEATLVRGISWGKDGYLIASLDGRTLSRVPESGGAPQPILTPEGDGNYRWPQHLPGGDAVLLTSGTSLASDYEDANIEWLSLKTGKHKVVQRGGYYGRYLPSGHMVFVRHGTLFAVPFDPVRGETHGTPVSILGDVAANSAWGAGHFSFSDTGTFAYASGNYEIVQPLAMLEPPSGSVPLGAAAGVNPKLSPDGKRLAEVVQGDLYVYDLTSETSTRITFNPNRPVHMPVWTPDGRHLVYTTSEGIFWTGSDGSGSTQKLFTGNAAMAESFAPDGRLAFHQSGGATNRDIWTVKIDWSNPNAPKAGTPELVLASPAADVDPVYSPDGRWLAYSTNPGGDYYLYVRAASGLGMWQVSPMPGRFPVWSRKTNELFFLTASGYIMVMDYKVTDGAFAAGKPRQFFNGPVWLTGNQPSFDISPDGKRAVASPVSKAIDSSELVFLLNFFDEVRRRVPAGK